MRTPSSLLTALLVAVISCALFVALLTATDRRHGTWMPVGAGGAGHWVMLAVSSSPLALLGDTAPARTDGFRNGRGDWQDSQRWAAEAASAWLVANQAGVTVRTPTMRALSGFSAGLPLALLYVDASTYGDLTGGRVVAATGALAFTGQVGAVSDVDLKAKAAVAAGAAVLFVPRAGDQPAARGELVVVPVATLAEAIRWLCEHGTATTSCPSAP